MNKLRTQNDKNTLKNAFSLLEMMVVLLIVSILAAATAPMVTKKMARSTGTGDSPWVFTGLNSSIAYNLNGNDNAPVIIGATSTPASLAAPTRLFIDSGNTASHIAFGNGNAVPLGITADPANGRIGISNQTIPNNSIAFGTGQTITQIAGTPKNVIIGDETKVYNSLCVAVGGASEAGESGSNATAVGYEAKANNNRATAIGSSATASAVSSTALGYKAQATGIGSTAIGAYYCDKTGHHTADKYETKATGKFSVAIGAGAQATADNQIVLGNENTTVYIPGRLVTNYFAVARSGVFYYSDDDKGLEYIYNYRVLSGKDVAGAVRPSAVQKPFWLEGYTLSDRRLKNVGETYAAGLEELKKLDFFHYTFKKDEAKTPHVGVIAQDLEKVFPDAVTKGEDGYLRIRMEDMFYAVINAVKELDTKITEIVENVTSLSKRVDEQEKTIAEQQKLIEDLEQRLAQVEKKKLAE